MDANGNGRVFLVSAARTPIGKFGGASAPAEARRLMPRSLLPAMALLALAIGACGSSQTSPPTSAALSPGGDCALVTQPGAADEPDRGGGELDMTDFGGGRWRLCLTEPTAATAERTAWCIWNEDRTAVSEIDGLQVSIGPREYDASISIGRNAFDFGTIDHGTGQVASYQPTGVPRGESTDDGRAGYLAFDVVLMVDAEGGPPPPGAEPGYAGLMRWQCADPPSPR